MAGLRFLERLRRTNKGLPPVSEENTEATLRSVIEYIGKILNTRQGSTVLAEDFGIPDFTSMGVNFSRDDMPELEKSIGDFVERCEPRLKNVRISFLPDNGNSLQMTFSLNGDLVLGNGQLVPIYLVTRFNQRGKVTISS